MASINNMNQQPTNEGNIANQKQIKQAMFRELLEQIMQNPMQEPDPIYFYNKYGKKMYSGEKYSVFSKMFSLIKHSAKNKILQENPQTLFWDSKQKRGRKYHSFYERAGVDKKLEEMLRTNPDAQINVDEFVELLGYPKGTKLKGDERVKIKTVLGVRIRKLAKELGLKRNAPRGNKKSRNRKPSQVIWWLSEALKPNQINYPELAKFLGHNWEKMTLSERRKIQAALYGTAYYATQRLPKQSLPKTTLKPKQVKMRTRTSH